MIAQKKEPRDIFDPGTSSTSRSWEGLVRSREAAKLLSMSEWQLRNLAHEGALSYIQRTPRSPMLFDVGDLRAWVEKEKVRANGR